MLDRMNFAKISSLIILAVLAAHPAQAHDWGRRAPHRYYYRHHQPYHHHDRHGRGDFGKIVVRLPRTFVKVIIGGKDYYHCDGAYYRKSGRHYTRVTPPHRRDMAYDY